MPTLDAEASVTLEPGTQDGAQVRLAGKGIKRLEGWGRGDMIVHVKVSLPRQITQRQRQLLLDFAEEERVRRAA